MKEKLKTFFLSKKTQYSLLGMLCISIIVIIMMMLAARKITSSHQTVVLIENIHSIPMLVDSSDPYEGKMLLQDKTFKENINLILQKLIKNGDTVIDIGAGYGTQTLLMSKLVGESGKVYSFEPLPNSFKLLKYSVLLNQFSNIELENKLIYSSSIPLGVEQLKNYPTMYFIHSNLKEVQDNNNMINLPGYKLDDLLLGKSNIKVVNFGSHGNEFAAIIGMHDLITHSADISFILHWNQKTFDIKAPHYKEIMANFYKADFDVFIINAEGTLSIVRQDQIYSYNDVDLLITKAEIQ